MGSLRIDDIDKSWHLRARMETVSTALGSPTGGCHKDSLFSIDSEARLPEESPYSSPRPAGSRSITTPPLLKTSVRKCGDPLMRALRKNSFEELQRTLAANPGAIDDFFLDHDFEPVLCAAVNFRCSIEVIKLLLEHGADATAQDKHGRTVRDLVQAKRTSTRSNPAAIQSAPWLQAFQGIPSLALNRDQASFVLPDDPKVQATQEVVMPIPTPPTSIAQQDDPLVAAFPRLAANSEAWLCEIAALLER